ncbi:cytochrome P450 4V2-like [Watersipora subatra]|uniref:cytochrome P450 4V2-like n=1 Tax=Watersipora subatra TaxID=2589382 RepID=UPI00355B9BEE
MEVCSIVYWTFRGLASLIIILSAGYLYWKTTRNKQLIDQIPGFKDWPIVGDVLHTGSTPSDFLEMVLKACDRSSAQGIVKIKMLEVPWVFLYTSDLVEKLQGSSKEIKKSYEYFSLHPWLGQGLLTSSGDAWRERRHMLTPTFHFSILKDFLEVFNEKALDLVEVLQRDHCDTDIEFDISTLVTLSTLDIICSTAMGVNIGALRDGNSEYVKALQVLKEAADSRPQKLLYYIDMVYNNTAIGQENNRCLRLVHEFSYKVIAERRAMKEEGISQSTGKLRPFLDLLLDCRDEQGNPLTDHELREEVDTFMFAGHDTTSTGISFTLYLLGIHPEVQKLCQEEIDQVLDTGGSISNADLNKLTYLELCIKESLRIFSPVPYVGRELIADTQFGDYLIPKGTAVFTLIMKLHRDPRVFPDPERFDPSRFTSENCTQRSPFAYIPFSAGPRNCIGQKFAMMELKTIVATLLRNFNIESVQSREELKINPALVIEPVDGIRVKLTSRQ